MYRRTIYSVLALVIVAFGSTAARADVVLEWNTIMLDTLVGQNPVNETRIAAITQLAVFEAVNAITDDYQPYLGTIYAPRGASAEAAAVAAAHVVLRNYVPDKGAALDAARAQSLAGILDGQAKEDGIVVGEKAANAMIDLREQDGSAPPQFHVPTSSEPGVWQLTVGCPPQGGVFLHWPNVIPFGIRRADQFRPGPPPALTSKKYKVAFNEVKAVGGVDSTERPQDRADVARYYAVVLAIRTWNPAATQVAAAQGRSLSHNARALALLNMALSDALVAVFDVKYHAPFWRPETAIPAGDTDGNWGTRGDPNFKPFISTPCHPSYVSAHASAAYAAVSVLERIYGRRGHYIVLSSPVVPGIVLDYSRFDRIASDIDDARVYGGIHWRFDQEAGARLGRRLGSYVYEHNLCRTHRRHRH
ncbi:MAG: vanadium-dependent haloperoxidase [Steroidobacteraceae bacterium]